jgi:nicotinamide/nicotinate riboside kinase
MLDPDDAAAGGVWTDPPNYFEQIVYPAYVKAHEDMFKDGNVEDGDLWPRWQGLTVLKPLEGSSEMSKAFELSCAAIIKACQAGKGTII